ncbi:MAG: DUF61 family protein [Candidatus Methanomethylophilaceae archaeon]|nr:DUF61 family protein [Candidatus Methanomethylophilaceae archaeon]
MSDDPMNIERMIADMNSSMPVNRRTVSDYLENGNLTYKTRSGETGDFGRGELEYIASFCTETEKLRLRIPIFVSTDTSSEAGAWKVEGNVEAEVVSKILGKKTYREGFLRLHYPDLADLRRKLPELAVVLFLP